jgi:DNA-binding MarR family transcriptional regulator
MFSDIIRILRNPSLISTYNTGLVQTKAYRTLQAETKRLLQPYGITTVEWAMLGVLYDNPNGLRFLPLAEVLGVEQSFVTVLTAKLKKKGLVQVVIDEHDRRHKWILLTSSAKPFVKKVEKVVRNGVRPILGDLTRKDILTYLKVLERIVDYSEKGIKNRYDKIA